MLDAWCPCDIEAESMNYDKVGKEKTWEGKTGG